MVAEIKGSFGVTPDGKVHPGDEKGSGESNDVVISTDGKGLAMEFAEKLQAEVGEVIKASVSAGAVSLGIEIDKETGEVGISMTAGQAKIYEHLYKDLPYR